MISELKRESQKAITLIEMLVAVVLIGSAMAAATVVYVSGGRFLKQAENKMKATNVAYAQLQEQLGRSFTELADATSPITGIACMGDTWSLDNYTTEADCIAADGIPFSWNTVITQLADGGIPYQHVGVTVNYDDVRRDSQLLAKSVFLDNIVVYPQVHIDSYESPEIIVGSGQLCPFGLIDTITEIPLPGSYQPISDHVLELPPYSAPKRIEVYYSIAIEVEDDTGLSPEGPDTIFTRAFLVNRDDATDRWPITTETRTPILWQPFFSSAGAEDLITRGSPPNQTTAPLLPNANYDIKIEWFKNTADDVTFAQQNEAIVRLRQINIVALLFEDY